VRPERYKVKRKRHLNTDCNKIWLVKRNIICPLRNLFYQNLNYTRLIRAHSIRNLHRITHWQKAQIIKGYFIFIFLYFWYLRNLKPFDYVSPNAASKTSCFALSNSLGNSKNWHPNQIFQHFSIDNIYQSQSNSSKNLINKISYFPEIKEGNISSMSSISIRWLSNLSINSGYSNCFISWYVRRHFDFTFTQLSQFRKLIASIFIIWLWKHMNN